MANKSNGRKTKNKGGRPVTFNEDIVKKLEEVFSLDGTVSEACFYAGISRETYYNHVKESSELYDRFESLRNKPVLSARKEVISAFTKNPELALKYLERKKKSEFAPKTEVDLNGTLTIGELLDQAEGKPVKKK